MWVLIDAVISLFGLIRGLFVGGGLIARVLGWLGSGFGVFVTGLGSLASMLFGGFSLIGSIWALVSAYQAVELARRILLITFVVFVFGFVMNYSLTNVLIYNGQSISSLYSSFLSSIESTGPLGHDLLAFASRFGIFTDIQIVLTVMFYTLIARISAHILFK